MSTAKKWSVELLIDEHEGRTRAEARLHTLDPTRLVGVGTARLNPADRDVPEIGDELAASRALADAAANDVEGVTATPARRDE
ncbi:dsRBD fold-containing protein [Lentzea sp. NEAU-D7]|uniref:dsRBD fold-containing protein n=1 Tax=Lentzea sp. NEAU-D7 TaxID=2994667 RepID=UPI00224B5599|nr:dsRBD fold-containing protein [Lentzea sp. NEAU-D7]MCX2951416.1 DUF1876 family protein [Lentzea sp. NEAU-D7]